MFHAHMIERNDEWWHGSVGDNLTNSPLERAQLCTQYKELVKHRPVNIIGKGEIAHKCSFEKSARS
jgi:hypothetical protein